MSLVRKFKRKFRESRLRPSDLMMVFTVFLCFFVGYSVTKVTSTIGYTTSTEQSIIEEIRSVGSLEDLKNDAGFREKVLKIIDEKPFVKNIIIDSDELKKSPELKQKVEAFIDENTN